MIRLDGAKLKEKSIIKQVEKAVLANFSQDDIFVVDACIVVEETIKTVNREQRNIDKVTDVLSFPYFEKLQLPAKKEDFSAADFDGKRILLGSLMICRKRAIEQAQEYGHSYEREIGFLTCHGMLHLLGFDHIKEEDEKVMFPLQEKIMDSVGLKRE